MKKILSLLALVMLSVVSVSAQKTIYLKPGVWDAAGARFAAYMYQDEQNAWAEFTAVEGMSVYSATVPETFGNIILVRLKPATDESFNADNNGLNWDNKWNQSDDIANVADNALYTITGWQTSDFTVSTYSIVEKPIPEGRYYIMAQAEESDNLMAAGHNWGTKGIINGTGLDFTLTFNESNNTYDIDSRVSNGDNNHFLSNGLWMDGPSYGWTIEEADYGHYICSTFDGVKKYIGVTATRELELTDTPYAWAFINADWWESNQLEGLKEATVTAPVDATFLIKCADFNRNDQRKSAWTMEASNQNLNGGCNGEHFNCCAESYHSVFTLSQTLAGAPAGVYALTAQGFYRQDGSDNDNLPYFYANDEKQTFPLRTGSENGMDTAGDSFLKGNYTIEPIYVQVTEGGQLTVGAKLETNTNLWCIFDNFQLKYYGANATIDQVKNAALFAQVKELKAKLDKIVISNEIEVEAVVSELTTVSNEVVPAEITTTEAAQAAIEKLTAAIEKGEGYIKAKNVLPQMKALTESTNFYTQEAYDNYYGQWYQKYEDGTLTGAEANALEDPFVVTGWRANNNVDDLLMSTWDAETMDWAKYYINTWSVEGATDGTDFAVPFFEYWTGDGDSLGEKVLTGKMSGLEPGTYGVSAWVRVRGKNGFTAPAYGITMQAANGEAVNAVAATAVPNSNFYVGQITAIGEVAEDGVLTLKFNVAADNNISWLSFKNVKFNKIQTYSAKFVNGGQWDKVYAYTWTGGDYDKVEQLGAWPGKEITADGSGIYNVTIVSQEAPANIIFSNGLEGESLVQTDDLVFEDGKAYGYGVDGLIPDGTYYVLNAETGAAVKADGNLDAKGSTITFTYDVLTQTYTIEGADFFAGNQWTVANVYEDMPGYYNISTTVEGATKYVIADTEGKLALADAAGENAVWIVLKKAYWEDIVNSTYTVAGTKNLTATENDWDIVEANQMKYNEETKLFEITYQNVTVSNDVKPEFKVVKTPMEGENSWYPTGDNWVITPEVLGGEGEYDITITFDPSDSKEIGVTGLKIADINITPESGSDIYEALIAAEMSVKPRNITINLADKGAYTVSGPLTVYANFEIQGNGATIDASNLNNNLVQMATTASPVVEYVSIHNANIKGLKKPLFYSTQKGYLINWLTIDNSIIEVAADATSIDFTKGSAARNFNIENSTIYAPVATTKSFYSSQSAQKLTELDPEGIQTFIIKNATMYNLATGKNFFSHRQSNQKWLAYTVENSIFVNCGKSGQVIKGMNGGQGGANPTWTITGNAFNFEVEGVMTDTSAAEATGDDAEPVQNSVAGVVTFTDAANGDFNGSFELAEGATAPESLGDPRWTITFGADQPAAQYYLVGNMTNWGLIDTYLLTENTEAEEGVEEYMITVDLEANEEIKVVKLVGTEKTWYPADADNYTIAEAGKYNIYFRPNADGGDTWYCGVLYVEKVIVDGINNVNTTADNAVIYNMKGQRVMNAQKGLYIVNGKKLVVK